jgi:hypothetical protein
MIKYYKINNQERKAYKKYPAVKTRTTNIKIKNNPNKKIRIKIYKERIINKIIIQKK